VANVPNVNDFSAHNGANRAHYILPFRKESTIIHKNVFFLTLKINASKNKLLFFQSRQLCALFFLLSKAYLRSKNEKMAPFFSFNLNFLFTLAALLYAKL